MRDVARLTTVVFDLGGVLIDWDPRHLYRQLFDDPDEMELFLADVTTAEWNGHQDAGRPWAEAVELLVAKLLPLNMTNHVLRTNSTRSRQRLRTKDELREDSRLHARLRAARPLPNEREDR